MSYDIHFRVKVENVNAWVDVGDFYANITWNVRKIIELSTGLPWLNEENNGFCIDVIPKIRHGLDELRLHPERYKPYEASNGWGSVEGTCHFFSQIIDAWERLLAENTELALAATFWIL